MNTTDTAFELIISESYAGEIECEALHSYVKCSGPVTHIMNSCMSRDRNICRNVAENSGKKLKCNTCAGCFLPARDCWSIRPI